MPSTRSSVSSVPPTGPCTARPEAISAEAGEGEPQLTVMALAEYVAGRMLGAAPNGSSYCARGLAAFAAEDRRAPFRG